MDKQTLKQYLAIVKEIGHLKEEKEGKQHPLPCQR